MDESILRTKITTLFRKHSNEGTTPRKVIETNIARDIRFCKDEISKLLDEMNMEKEMKRKKVRQEKRVSYERGNHESMEKELRSFR